MTMANIRITVRMDPWVRPYLMLMDRLGCKGKAAQAVVDFVKAEGMRPV